MCRWLNLSLRPVPPTPLPAHPKAGGALLDKFRKTGRCPDCDGELHVGPRGMLAVNVTCDTCGHRFNIGFAWGSAFFLERI